MKYSVIINSVKTVNSIENSWNKSNYIDLLKELDFYDAKITDENELKDLLFMALSDNDPEAAAEILLRYKLTNKLNDGQIAEISHEMLDDKISEEFADISLHFDLYKINQLLFNAFNGTFPNIKATIIEFQIKPQGQTHDTITKAHMIKALQGALVNNNLIDRLYHDELQGKDKFTEAESIIWELHELEKNHYKIITSDYWMSKDDFENSEYEIEVIDFEDDEA